MTNSDESPPRPDYKQKKEKNWNPQKLVLNHPTLIILEQKCRCRLHLQQILTQMFKTHLVGFTFPTSRLIYSAAAAIIPPSLDIATTLLYHFTPHPNLFIFNTLISSSSSCFSLYKFMLNSSISPDHTTLLSLLRATSLPSVAKQVHSQAISLGLSHHPYLHNSFLKIYLQTGSTTLVDSILTHFPAYTDLVSFNILILWHAKHGFPLKSFHFLHRMISSGISPDRQTIPGILISSARLRDLPLGRATHGWSLRRVLLAETSCMNSLLDMYMRCGEKGRAEKVFESMGEKKDSVSWNIVVAGCIRELDMNMARKYFDRMPSRDLVSWNSMMAGYVRVGDVRRVWGLFREMVRHGVAGDGFTAVNLMGAAAEEGWVEAGRRVHGWVVRRRIEEDVHLVSAMVSMYCKCGSVGWGEVVFRKAAEKDVGVWTAMIGGRGMNGEGGEAVRLLEEMKRKGVKANRITYVAALGACSRGGMVEEGMEIWDGMEEVGVEHYGCVVDMLGRAGRVEEAAEVAERMGDGASAAVWGAVMGAAREQGETEVGERAMRGLGRVEPGEDGGYVAMANVYSGCGRWGRAGKVREALDKGKKMKIGIKKKNAGVSSIAVIEVLE